MSKTEYNLNLAKGKYPISECWNNKGKLMESIGYLRAIKDYFPALDSKGEITDEMIARIDMYIDLEKNGANRDETQWHVIPAYKDLSIAKCAEIINDATSHGYEFKIENGNILYRLLPNPYQE